MHPTAKLLPRLPELLFAAVLVWLFASGQGWTVLLADGDTGWHIRNGERILETRQVPVQDPFSFGSDGHPWFAWEWMSDVIFAILYRQAGLKSVAVFCGICIAASISILFRHLLWRSVGVCIALPLALLAAGASSVHYLARPHAIGLLLFAMVNWIIDCSRASRGWTRWTLPLVFLIWANCHGSFLAGLAMLVFWVGTERISGTPDGGFRHLTLVGLSAGATFCNPYGWLLHAHAIEYLRSDWIQAWIEEFQSPKFRSESMLQFEVVLIIGLASLPWLFRRREFYGFAVILLWAHQSLASVRHVPLYCIAAVPFAGLWLQSISDESRHRRHLGTFLRALNGIDRQWRPWTYGVTLWPLAICIAFGISTAIPGISGPPVGFPANKFPVDLLSRHAALFETGSSPLRVFSSDQWSDYLIFRLHPKVRVFFDGRSDFFAGWRGKEYQELMRGGPTARATLDRERIQVALLPVDWPLVQILRLRPEWHVLDSNDQGVLFERSQRENAVLPNQKSAFVR